MSDTRTITAALYARVSTEDQHCEIQLSCLNAYAKRAGWSTIEYVEKLSGKEGGKRPQLEQLLEDVRMKRIDTVLVHKLDRFGRSTLDTLQNIKTLDFYKVRFQTVEGKIDTDDESPIGKFTLTLLAAVAELERAFIIERTQGGFKAYREAFALGRIGKTRHSKSKKDLPAHRRSHQSTGTASQWIISPGYCPQTGNRPRNGAQVDSCVPITGFNGLTFGVDSTRAPSPKSDVPEPLVCGTMARCKQGTYNSLASTLSVR
jgi:DNA invertase Pin-like site-specific DNA recombinase